MSEPGIGHEHEQPFSARFTWTMAAIIIALGLPGLILGLPHWWGAEVVHLPLLVETAIFGMGILSAAFLLGAASEAAEHDLPSSLSLAILAFVAVLPEYAVDLVFAWRAGEDPTQAQYAVANMTGGNRLLIGVGWAAVLVAYFLIKRGRYIQLPQSISIEVGALFIATLYSFTIPLKGSISLLDSLILFSLFGFYLYRISRQPRAEVEIAGPAAAVAALPKAKRRTVVGLMFFYAALVIVASAEPFADGLVETGTEFGIDEFLLVQWVAPLASESPEFLAAVYLVWRGNESGGLTALISSKVNQWTLLIGSLAVAYSISGGHWDIFSGWQMDGLPMDSRQQEEVLLTAAQSLFAVLLILDKRLSPSAAIPLFGLFIVQFVLTDETARLWLSGVYLVLSAGLLVWDWRRLGRLTREAFTGRIPDEPAPQVDVEPAIVRGGGD